MGVDLYVGPLARYYSRNWETPSARLARENNLNFRTFHSSGAPPDALSHMVSTERSEVFRDRMKNKLGALLDWSWTPRHPTRLIN